MSTHSIQMPASARSWTSGTPAASPLPSHNLETLDLSSNQLTGGIPASLGQLGKSSAPGAAAAPPSAAAKPRGRRTFAFVFPMASGHINPSFPLARRLVELGHSVHYLCFEQMRKAVEDTGAAFHSALRWEQELYSTRQPDAGGAMAALMQEHGVTTQTLAMLALRFVQLELQLPGVLRFLTHIGADCLVCCPMINTEAAVAARALHLPCVSLMTVAGPGAWETLVKDKVLTRMDELEELDRMLLDFTPHVKAVEALNRKYGLDIPAEIRKPVGMLDGCVLSSVTLVTTCEQLQDPMTEVLTEAYRESGTSFVAVGALLDRAGAARAGTHKSKDDEHRGSTTRPPASAHTAESVVEAVWQAREAGRPVVLVSMGTVLTGDMPFMGWDERQVGADGTPYGLRGSELCRGVWGGAFDAFGAARAEEGPLLVVALGPQKDPLGELKAPANAICLPSLPQLDILKAGVDLFLTHGGQNSFTEALSEATPLVVCPGFGDQVVNADKAVALGAGLKVDRPEPEAGLEAEAVAEYRCELRRALRRVMCGSTYKQATERCAEHLSSAGGVAKAVEVILATEASHAALGEAAPGIASSAPKFGA